MCPRRVPEAEGERLSGEAKCGARASMMGSEAKYGGPGGSGRDGGDLTGFLEGSYPRGRELETRSQSSITQSTQIQFLHWYSFLYCLVMVIKNQIKFYPLFPSLFK